MINFNFKVIENGLIDIAVSHKTNYVNHLSDWKDEGDFTPSFTFLNCNIPLLSDIRIFCEKNNIDKNLIESSDSWGYIGIEFNLEE